MKKQALALIVAMFGFHVSAQAGNNPLVDQALMENIAEKQILKKEMFGDSVVRPTRDTANTDLNTKYRSGLEVIIGDELGGFANSTEQAAKAEAPKIADSLKENETN